MEAEVATMYELVVVADGGRGVRTAEGGREVAPPPEPCPTAASLDDDDAIIIMSASFMVACCASRRAWGCDSWRAVSRSRPARADSSGGGRGPADGGLDAAALMCFGPAALCGRAAEDAVSFDDPDMCFAGWLVVVYLETDRNRSRRLLLPCQTKRST